MANNKLKNAFFSFKLLFNELALANILVAKFILSGISLFIPSMTFFALLELFDTQDSIRFCFFVSSKYE